MTSSRPVAPPVERATPPPSSRAVNRLLCWVLASPRRSGPLGGSLLVLHLVGRTSGRPFSFPVAYRPADDGRLLVLTSSPWRVNLRGRPDVEVTLRGRRYPAVAELVEDLDEVAAVYRQLLEEVGVEHATRRLGLRVAVDGVPTRAELADAVRRDHLALVYLHVLRPG